MHINAKCELEKNSDPSVTHKIYQNEKKKNATATILLNDDL